MCLISLKTEKVATEIMDPKEVIQMDRRDDDFYENYGQNQYQNRYNYQNQYDDQNQNQYQYRYNPQNQYQYQNQNNFRYPNNFQNRYSPVRRISLMNTIIIVINVIVFIVLEVLGDTENAYFMLRHGASYADYVLDGHQYWRLFTCMFLHFGFRHLLNNMIVLGFLGDNLERALGKVKYLVVYLGGGMLANVISVLIEYYKGDNVVSAGASGAIFAVVGGLIYILIYHRGRYEDLNLQRVLLFAAMSIYLGLQSTQTDNVAHIGGLIFGLTLTMILYRKKQN